MTNVDINDPIEKLGLSVRTYNALKNSGILTVCDLLDYPQDHFQYIRNMGVKSVKEIFEVLEKLNIFIEAGTNETITPPEKEIKYYIDNVGNKYIDEKIEELELSVRAKNCLTNSGILFFSQLKETLSEELIRIRNMGVKTLIEIENLRVHHVSPSLSEEVVNSEDQESTSEFNKILKYVYDEIGRPLHIPAHVLNRMIMPMSSEIMDLKEEWLNQDTVFEEKLMMLFLTNGDFRLVSENYIYSLLFKTVYGLEEEEIRMSLPTMLRHHKILEELLNGLLDQNKIDILFDNRFSIVYECYESGIPNVLKDREREIVLLRIQGKTLEEIGHNLNVTRERIRQIEAKAIKKLNDSGIKFKEDIYFDIFKRYDITKRDFEIALNQPGIFQYLNIRYGNLRCEETELKPLNNIIEDKEVPAVIRKCFEKAAYRNYVKIGTQYVPCTRAELVKYVIKTYAKDEISFETFSSLYYDLLKKLELFDNSRLHFTERGYMNTLYTFKWVLWKFGKKFRYYNIDDYDFAELFETLNFNQYNDIEISTLKFIKMYPDLMRAYDIRDEYELHNLLKKLCDSEAYSDVSFARMPIIVFGNASRENQVYELLTALAPISNVDFAQSYEAEYGIAAETVLANFMIPFDKYFHEGIYSFDFETLPLDAERELKYLLINDFYFLSEIKEIFKSNFPKVDLKLLNPYTIKNIGFRLNSNYAFKDKYSSAVEYFNSILTGSDIVDIDKIPSKVREIISFYSHLYSLKADYELVEFLPNKYINFRRLVERGITKQMFIQYRDDVASFIGEGKYFTLHHLRHLGFSHDLDELGFDDWFYTSIIIEDKISLSYQRVGGNKLMMYGTDSIRFGNFLEYLVYSQEFLSVDFYDLIEILNKQYNLVMNPYKLIETIKETSLFYDAISEKVYADYDTYYEGV